MGKLVVVTGVPGVGKSTVVAGALENLKAEGLVYELVNYGDVMLELMQERMGVTDRDEMRKIPFEPYQEIQRAAAERIAAKAKLKPVLLDTQCSVKKPEGYLPGLPKWVLEGLQPKSIVVIEAEAKEVAARRTKDVARRRDKELLAEVAEHQQLNRALAMAYATFVGATVKIVKNRSGKLSEAVNDMVATLR
ncbi:MAG: adenylate kinase [Hadesarchaea archaeon DG-33-1]|nr:MAG: adenylate kinase [Hadesarchaea archaeon DG-33-1]